jgi:hypothetical protein
MSLLPRRVSQGLSTGFAAILAVLLSAIGGFRQGFDRTVRDDGDEDRPAVVCRWAEAPNRYAAAPSDARSVAHASALPCPPATHGRPDAESAPAAVTVPAPGPRLGAANGPRAP